MQDDCKQLRLIVVMAVLLILSGCFIRIPLSYEPHALASPADAMAVIHQTLEAQHAQYAPIELEVSESGFSMLRSTSNPLLGTQHLNRTAIRFSAISEVSLSKKNRWFAVTLAGANGVALLHVYTPDKASAHRFIDALDTMRRFASSSGSE